MNHHDHFTEKHCPRCECVTTHEAPREAEPDVNLPAIGSVCCECELEHTDAPLPRWAAIDED